jgi:hypothetical protein
MAAGTAPSPELLMHAMRAGVSEYLTKPVTAESLADVLERMDRRLGAASGVREPGKLLAFFSAKGGSGSTTVATNLAINLQQLTGKRTLLADLDLGTRRDRAVHGRAAALQLRGPGPQLSTGWTRSCWRRTSSGTTRASTCCRRRSSRTRWRPCPSTGAGRSSTS